MLKERRLLKFRSSEAIKRDAETKAEIITLTSCISKAFYSFPNIFQIRLPPYYQGMRALSNQAPSPVATTSQIPHNKITSFTNPLKPMALFKFNYNAASKHFPESNVPNRRELPEASRHEIWAVGGGKGGIGKTLLSTNLAILLTWYKQRVIVVDLDLGGANLHTTLGVDTPSKTLSDFLLGRVEEVSELLHPTPYKNLQIISGAHDPVGIANVPHIEKARLIRKFKESESDIVLLDLGAGTANNTLDFFLLADKKIVVITPDPTSIENAYRFIKAAFYRMLRSAAPSPFVRQTIEQAINKKGIDSPKDLIAEIARLSPEEGNIIRAKMQQFKISIILNQARNMTEATIGKNVELVASRYFGIPVNYAGFLAYDNAVWQSIRKRVPFIMDSPNSSAVTQLEECLRNLIKVK